ncbi:MAG: hypothetical protein HUJ63_05500, partial [Enterococcus sp.]|nr:hypothetical protein [Enterococcus sp.]
SKTKTPKGKTFLSIAKSYIENGKSKTKTVLKLGYLEDLLLEIEDPISHFEKLAAKMTQEEKDSQILARIDIDTLRSSKNSNYNEKRLFPVTHLGIPLMLRIYEDLKLDKLAKKIDAELNVDFNFEDFFRYYFIVHYLFPIYYLDSFELKKYFFCRLDFDGVTQCEQFYSLIRIYEKDVRDWLRQVLDPQDYQYYDAHYQQIIQSSIKKHFAGKDFISHYLSLVKFKNRAKLGWMTMDYVAYVVLEIISKKLRSYHSLVKIARSLSNLYCYNIYGDTWALTFKDTVSDKLFRLVGLKPPSKFLSTQDIIEIYPANTALKENLSLIQQNSAKTNQSKVNGSKQQRIVELKKNEKLDFKSRDTRNLGQALALRYFYLLNLEPIIVKIKKQHRLNFDPALANKHLLALHSSFLYEFSYNPNLRLLSPFDNQLSLVQLLRFYRCITPFAEAVQSSIEKFLGPKPSREFSEIYERDFLLPLRGHLQLIENVFSQSMKNSRVDYKLSKGFSIYDRLVKSMGFYICKKLKQPFNMENFNKLVFEMRNTNCVRIKDNLWLSCKACELNDPMFKALGFAPLKPLLQTSELRSYFSKPK